ncbi:sulfotransferase, partial [bacterium]|nr:sulfotransferase [bacterium]
DCLAITPDILNIPVDYPTKETGLFVRGFSNEEIMEKVSRLRHDKLLVEKTPSHLLELDRIRQTFPESKIVLIRRNPLDVIHSMLQKNFFWKDSPKTLINAVNLYEKFSSAEAQFSDYDYILTYEKLWENPIRETHKLFEHLNLRSDSSSAIIEKTKYGRSLPPELKTVFNVGTPGQGLETFTSDEVNFIQQRLQAVHNWPNELSEQYVGKYDEKMRILLSNHHLLDYTGSEIFTYTIAEFLKRKGHGVVVYSNYVDRMLSRFQAIKVPVVHDLAIVKGENFNVAHVHHNINALEIRYHFPDLPIIFLSHGVLPFLEQPPSIDLKISKFLAVSEEVKENLLNKGTKEKHIEIFRNMVDSSKFFPASKIGAKPRKALVLSSRIDFHKKTIIQKACRKLNIECKFIGGKYGEVSHDLIPRYINDVD